MDLTQKRRRRAKGRWMRLRDYQLLVRYMEDRDMTQARLGRYAEVSRQFIHSLATGQKTTCTPAVAERIEEALGLLKGTLFEPKGFPHAQLSTPHSGRLEKVAS